RSLVRRAADSFLRRRLCRLHSFFCQTEYQTLSSFSPIRLFSQSADMFLRSSFRYLLLAAAVTSAVAQSGSKHVFAHFIVRDLSLFWQNLSNSIAGRKCCRNDSPTVGVRYPTSQRRPHRRFRAQHRRQRPQHRRHPAERLCGRRGRRRLQALSLLRL
ncbi:hypothetical protein T310_9233, partial [Rasamsonia emersonii CBS 393.64]